MARRIPPSGRRLGRNSWNGGSRSGKKSHRCNSQRDGSRRGWFPSARQCGIVHANGNADQEPRGVGAEQSNPEEDEEETTTDLAPSEDRPGATDGSGAGPRPVVASERRRMGHGAHRAGRARSALLPRFVGPGGCRHLRRAAVPVRHVGLRRSVGHRSHRPVAHERLLQRGSIGSSHDPTRSIAACSEPVGDGTRTSSSARSATRCSSTLTLLRDAERTAW